jgi:hypothetical protein
VSDALPAAEAEREARAWLARLRVRTAAQVARSGRLEEAAVYLEPSGDPEAEDDATLDLLAKVRAQQGRLEDAAALWDVVLRRAPARDDVRRALARVEALRPGATRGAPRGRRSVPAPRPVPAAPAPAGGAPAVVTSTLGGTVVAWDEGATLLFGRPADLALGTPVALLFAPVSRRTDERNVADVRAGESVFSCVAKFSVAGGAPRRASYDLEGVLDPAGRLVALRRTVRAAAE